MSAPLHSVREGVIPAIAKSTPITPTEAHRDIVRQMLDRCYSAGSVDYFAQLIAESEGRVHSALTKRAERAEAEVSRLTDTLDLMRDEFLRIIACPGCNGEIEDLANRAQLNLIQRVPVIIQRDRAEAQASKLRITLEDEREKARVLREALLSIDEEWTANHDSPFAAGNKMRAYAEGALAATEPTNTEGVSP